MKSGKKKFPKLKWRTAYFAFRRTTTKRKPADGNPWWLMSIILRPLQVRGCFPNPREQPQNPQHRERGGPRISIWGLRLSFGRQRCFFYRRVCVVGKCEGRMERWRSVCVWNTKHIYVGRRKQIYKGYKKKVKEKGTLTPHLNFTCGLEKNVDCVL